LLVASAFKSANPNSWSSGAGAHDIGASLGEQQTPGGGGACTLEATSATSASATTSAFRFACSWVLRRRSHCRAKSRVISLSSSVQRLNVFCGAICYVFSRVAAAKSMVASALAHKACSFTFMCRWCHSPWTLGGGGGAPLTIKSYIMCVRHLHLNILIYGFLVDKK
jgi:hypothetical protein